MRPKVLSIVNAKSYTRHEQGTWDNVGSARWGRLTSKLFSRWISLSLSLFSTLSPSLSLSVTPSLCLSACLTLFLSLYLCVFCLQVSLSLFFVCKCHPCADTYCRWQRSDTMPRLFWKHKERGKKRSIVPAETAQPLLAARASPNQTLAAFS